ncbi:unnamed protein product [Ceutorhynchus assimilis]|uniref:Uncharacterized protein n=1 Tax=Ceutorhynchus assimilis TaxID=467358 RepID=A0A9N9MB70_9CUCU|nr:unnamed protein product [Ceutorhynchus assimilis]
MQYLDEDYCRICLEFFPCIEGTHISKEVKLNKTISEIIEECASVQISEKDPYSNYLCSQCHQKLIALNDFRALIIKSDIILKQKQFPFKTHLDIDVIKNEKENLIKEEKAADENLETNENLVRINAGRKPSKLPKRNRKVHKFQCDICNKTLLGRSNRLTQHIITAHSDIKNFQCEICQKKFKSKQQLVNHGRVHTGEKPYKCYTCEETFASNQNLFNHNKKHTGQYKSYKCALCDKGYSTPGEFETHKRIVHTGEKPFLCEICSQTYSSARNLGLHINRVHKKTEKCPKCSLMFNTKRLQQHLQKHQDKEAGIRRYTCDKCGKGFFTPHALKRHEVVHTKERPYSCQICDKSFSLKSGVNMHMKTHSDVREFSCDVCSKTFKYKQHLQMHLKEKHKEVAS